MLYIAAESPSVLGERVSAWQAHENVQDNGVHWYPHPINLLDQVDTFTVGAYAKEIGAHAVMIDTIARCMVSADENSGRDMGQVVAGLDIIREASGACVLGVHHTGKDSERGARGHSSLRAAVGTELEVRGGDGTVTIITRKQRAGVEAEPLNLRLVPVGDGVALSTWRPGLDDGSLPPKTVEVLDTLAAIEVDGAVSTTTWRKSGDIKERTFYRAVKLLIQADKVRNVGTEKAPGTSLLPLPQVLPRTARPATAVLPATATPLWGGRWQ